MTSDNISQYVKRSIRVVLLTSHNDRQPYELYICTWTESSPHKLGHTVLEYWEMTAYAGPCLRLLDEWEQDAGQMKDHDEF